MNTPIERAEHEAFAELMKSENERLREENNRQNHRIDVLENEVREVRSLATSVERLASNMEAMLKEQEKQGLRLAALEQKPAKRWDGIVDKFVAGIVGALAAGLFAGAIYLLTQVM